jgi:hypothetical protein
MVVDEVEASLKVSQCEAAGIVALTLQQLDEMQVMKLEPWMLGALEKITLKNCMNNSDYLFATINRYSGK